MSVRGEVRKEKVLICLLLIACIQCKLNESKKGHIFLLQHISANMYVVCFDISLHYNVYVKDDASTLYIIAVVTSLVGSEGRL